jgi:hypothetical protein
MTQQTLIAMWTGSLQIMNLLLANHEQALLTDCLQDKLSEWSQPLAPFLLQKRMNGCLP